MNNAEKLLSLAVTLADYIETTLEALLEEARSTRKIKYGLISGEVGDAIKVVKEIDTEHTLTTADGSEKHEAKENLKQAAITSGIPLDSWTREDLAKEIKSVKVQRAKRAAEHDRLKRIIDTASPEERFAAEVCLGDKMNDNYFVVVKLLADAIEYARKPAHLENHA